MSGYNSVNFGYLGGPGSGGSGGSALPPVAVVVGEAGAPVNGASTYQNDDLKNLGSTNHSRIQIEIDGNIMYNFGDIATFDYDPVTGTLDINPGSFVTGSVLYVDRNQ